MLEYSSLHQRRGRRSHCEGGAPRRTRHPPPVVPVVDHSFHALLWVVFCDALLWVVFCAESAPYFLCAGLVSIVSGTLWPFCTVCRTRSLRSRGWFGLAALVLLEYTFAKNKPTFSPCLPPRPPPPRKKTRPLRSAGGGAIDLTLDSVEP